MNMRIGGLASGMDIDQIVKDLMKAERIPLDKLKQKKQTLEWQRDDYRSMNTLLLDFRTELTQMKLTTKYRARSVTSSNEALATATASSAASRGSYTISNVTQLATAAYRVSGKVTGDSGPKIDASKSLDSQTTNFASNISWKQGSVESKTLTGNGGTSGLNLDLEKSGVKILTDSISSMSVKVNGVAYEVVAELDTDPKVSKNQVKIDETGNLEFGTIIKEGAIVKVDYVTDKKVEETTLTADATTFQLSKTNINIKSDVNNDGVVDENDIQFKLEIGGTSYSVDTNGNIINSENDNEVLGTFDNEKGTIHFNNKQTSGTTIKVTYTQNYTDFSVTSQTSKGEVKENFLIQSSETLNQVINRVNASNAGVSMLYDSASDKISLMRKETGNFGGTSEDDMTVSGSLGSSLLLNDDDITNNGAKKQKGTNAEFTINGLTTSRSSNTFDMNGVTITLKKEGPGETATLAINNDSNIVFDNIKSFVDKYNELIDKINKKVSEERYRSYTPLTDGQREQLSDKQQEQWEEKAKSGLLRRDSILTGALSSMRQDFYSPVSNNQTDPLYRQLTSIGITTTANYLEGGKLEINEAKLKEAINNNPEAVEALFRGGGDSSVESEKGIVHRLYESVNGTMDKLKARAGNAFSTNEQFTIGKSLKSVDDQIDSFEDRLKQIEDRYWRQFTAMEKAIQRANSQSSYLMQQFSGGN
ncbi:flagellar capping protein [Schinkia azotoformans MEV2011]|uniref:Flagellar hook-associated protein 2 n=1 Tax=Schinkia azotoformans MEV2011 TaxID=1348973 RepID=A0A072NSV5_SCHAZ|nr:flagellar filament capping protein FliD [Schinkia azotoformans]KEF40307.1 flagellar capping protein [Schinkia azotoformans MEV2011]MEC1696385.1 flagellar filament capping protein FliD [Schinkia azotoformans]MEC1724057.1 flagellar filament capping protein FliD [Schinkia azotoformans]